MSCSYKKIEPKNTDTTEYDLNDKTLTAEKITLEKILMNSDYDNMLYVIIHQNGDVSEILNLYMVNENTLLGDDYVFLDVCYVEYYETENITEDFILGSGEIKVKSSFKNKVNWSDFHIIGNRLRGVEGENVKDALSRAEDGEFAFLIWNGGSKALDLNSASLGDYRSKELTGDDNGVVSLIIDMFKDRGEKPNDHFGVADSYR